MDLMMLAMILTLEFAFMIIGFIMRNGYIIPELISTMIGLLLIQGLLNEVTITYYSGGTLVSYLLPTYFVMPFGFLAVFPIIYVVLRLRGN